ncbi:MAG: haloalkane dehalogenase [Bacteroidota bacterium]
MPTIQTPDTRFEFIQDFPYQPKYIEVNGFRIHYIDEGEGEVILALHGEPTWSYLYRKFIPTLKEKYRFVSMDFVGFGRSDKLSKVKDYTVKMHFEVLEGFIRQMSLSDITLVCQDWGGLLGLSMLGAHPDWFKRVVIMNTALPTGDQPMPKAFHVWKRYARWHPTLPIGGIVKWGSYRKDQFTDEIKKAYDAPFPSSQHKAGARAFPKLVPMTPDYEAVSYHKRAIAELGQWDKPCVVMFSDKDPIMKPARQFFLDLVPTAVNVRIRDAGHFLQEDAGEEIAGYIDEFMQGSLSV